MPKGQINGHTDPNKPHISTLPRPAKRKSRSLSELHDLQRRLHELGMKPKAEARDVALCATAWARLDAQRMDLLGIPRAGQLRPEMPVKRRKLTASTWEEPKQIGQIVDVQIGPSAQAKAEPIVPTAQPDVAPDTTQTKA